MLVNYLWMFCEGLHLHLVLVVVSLLAAIEAVKINLNSNSRAGVHKRYSGHAMVRRRWLDLPIILDFAVCPDPWTLFQRYRAVS
jgi:hypothetical protein